MKYGDGLWEGASCKWPCQPLGCRAPINNSQLAAICKEESIPNIQNPTRSTQHLRPRSTPKRHTAELHTASFSLTLHSTYCTLPHCTSSISYCTTSDHTPPTTHCVPHSAECSSCTPHIAQHHIKRNPLPCHFASPLTTLPTTHHAPYITYRCSSKSQTSGNHTPQGLRFPKKSQTPSGNGNLPPLILYTRF